MSEGKKVIFICQKYPMLRMVFKRDKTIMVDGEIIKQPQEYIGFIKTSFGGRYETSDQEKIAWMREQQQYLEGFIVEVSESDLGKALKDEAAEAHPVHVGMSGTVARAPQPAFKAPAPLPVAKVGAVMVPPAAEVPTVEEQAPAEQPW